MVCRLYQREPREARGGATGCTDPWSTSFRCMRRCGVKDRRVTLQLPLFPGYVFVRMALQDACVCSRFGVARLVGLTGRQRRCRKKKSRRCVPAWKWGASGAASLFEGGRRVRVKGGPMTGMEGIWCAARVSSAWWFRSTKSSGLWPSKWMLRNFSQFDKSA